MGRSNIGRAEMCGYNGERGDDSVAFQRVRRWPREREQGDFQNPQDPEGRSSLGGPGDHCGSPARPLFS